MHIMILKSTSCIGNLFLMHTSTHMYVFMFVHENVLHIRTFIHYPLLCFKQRLLFSIVTYIQTLICMHHMQFIHKMLKEKPELLVTLVQRKRFNTFMHFFFINVFMLLLVQLLLLLFLYICVKQIHVCVYVSLCIRFNACAHPIESENKACSKIA